MTWISASVDLSFWFGNSVHLVNCDDSLNLFVYLFSFGKVRNFFVEFCWFVHKMKFLKKKKCFFIRLHTRMAKTAPKSSPPTPAPRPNQWGAPWLPRSQWEVPRLPPNQSEARNSSGRGRTMATRCGNSLARRGRVITGGDFNSLCIFFISICHLCEQILA